MPKLKTHRGAAKRFKKTGTGKFKRGQSKMRHILTSKETKTKRKLAHQLPGFRRRPQEGCPHDSLRLIFPGRKAPSARAESGSGTQSE